MLAIVVVDGGVLIVRSDGRGRPLHQYVVALFRRQLDRPDRGHERARTARREDGLRLRIDQPIR